MPEDSTDVPPNAPTLSDALYEIADPALAKIVGDAVWFCWEQGRPNYSPTPERWRFMEEYIAGRIPTARLQDEAWAACQARRDMYGVVAGRRGTSSASANVATSAAHPRRFPTHEFENSEGELRDIHDTYESRENGDLPSRVSDAFGRQELSMYRIVSCTFRSKGCPEATAILLMVPL